MAPRHRIDDAAYPDDLAAARWFGGGSWRADTVGSVIERGAAANGDAIAIVDGSARVSYSELEIRTAAAASRMLEEGLQPGDAVLIQVGIGATAAIGLLALMRAGLVPVCAVPRYRSFEMGALAELSGARGHLIEPGAAGSFDLIALAEDLREAHPNLEFLFVTGPDAQPRTLALEGSPAHHRELPELTPFDLAAFQLSGGTTGVPKIIPRFHAEYLGYADAWAARLEIGREDVLLWCLPISHNAGMIGFLLPALLRQATLVLLPHFEVDSFFAAIERERVTLTGSIGPIAAHLLDVEHPERFDLSSMRLFLTLNRAAEIENHLGVSAMNMFGITEGLLMASRPSAPADARHRTVGNPVCPQDEVVVLAPNEERVVEDGEVGELCFRRPSTLTAYYRQPDATRDAFTSDRFFRSGDLVRRHDISGETCFSFEGRLKDNIDRGGREVRHGRDRSAPRSTLRDSGSVRGRDA